MFNSSRLCTTVALSYAAIAVTMLSDAAFAHGYLENSRSKLCSTGVNTNCGAIQYEPQSVEGPDGFPEAGPADGTLAAAGSAAWAPLNSQSVDRWQKTNMSAGDTVFHWSFTANHVTKDFSYYITKNSWNPSAPLSRAQFELDPFCYHDAGFVRPDAETYHNCTIPQRQGYHVILAVWDVGDTGLSFYSTVDAQFGTGGNTPPDDSDAPTDPDTESGDDEVPLNPTHVKLGDIYPSLDLRKDDVVTLRLFTDFGEILDQRVNYTVKSNANGRANRWPRSLALFINQLGLNVIAGVLNDSTGRITPRLGKNSVYSTTTSDIVRTEIAFQISDSGNDGDDNNDSDSTRVYPEGYGNYLVSSYITGTDGHQYRCTVAGWCNASRYYYEPGFGLAWPEAWSRVSVNTTPTETNVDYQYPTGRGSYATGTIVGAAGSIYRCKVAGWCNSTSELYYAPNSGLVWQQAWGRVE